MFSSKGILSLTGIAMLVAVGTVFKERERERAFAGLSRVGEGSSEYRMAADRHADKQLESASEALPAYDAVSAGGWLDKLRELADLAGRDAQAAVAEVAAIADKQERKAAAIVVCRVIAGRDPELALRSAWAFDIGRLADESAEHETLELLARLWAEADAADALKWCGSLPADEEGRRDSIVRGIVFAIARSNPAIAARLTVDYHHPGEAGMDAAFESVAAQWAAQNYHEASAWVANLPDGVVRERGIEGIVNAGLADPELLNKQ